MKLTIDLEMPEQRSSSPAPRKPSIEEQVRNAVERIENTGHPSHGEWLLINKLRRSLVKMKKTPRVQNLLDMIEPVLSKYGYHGVSTEEGK